MFTSYYSKYKGKNSVSIAARAPKWYKGKEFKVLAPKYWFFKKYKEDGDWDFFAKQYRREVLDLLDPQEIANELGTEAVLLCWESSEKACHRHLVSEWMRNNGIDIRELKDATV